MKKILFSIAVLAVALGFTACSNEDEALSVKGGKTTVMAMTETGTRTALADDGKGAYDVVWSTGDQITIGEETFTLKSGAGSTTATFEGTVPADDGTYKAYYGINENLDFGPTQYYKEGKISNFPMLATAKVEGGKIEPLQFKNICGILSLTVKGTAKIKSIKVSANEPMSGTVNTNLLFTENMASLSDEGDKYLELDCGEEGVDLTEEGAVFNIALLADTYTGVKIELTDTKGNSCTKTFKGTDGLKIERSKITKVSFAATITTGKAYAKEPDCDVRWVQLWKDGPKFAEYNVGATSVTEYGGYYYWGSTYANGEGIKWDGTYNTDTEKLTGNLDTATALWGEKWRMPSFDELLELYTICTCEWTDDYMGSKISGYILTGKGDYVNNSVFLPAAGYCINAKGVGVVETLNKEVNCWLSTLESSDDNKNADCFWVTKDHYYGATTSYRSNCYSVRPVLVE